MKKANFGTDFDLLVARIPEAATSVPFATATAATARSVASTTTTTTPTAAATASSAEFVRTSATCASAYRVWVSLFVVMCICTDYSIA